ncbi:MAG: hypothetical protein AABX70_06130, partial [Nanoarchaeota archaeon]
FSPPVNLFRRTVVVTPQAPPLRKAPTPATTQLKNKLENLFQQFGGPNSPPSKAVARAPPTPPRPLARAATPFKAKPATKPTVKKAKKGKVTHRSTKPSGKYLDLTKRYDKQLNNLEKINKDLKKTDDDIFRKIDKLDEENKKAELKKKK